MAKTEIERIQYYRPPGVVGPCTAGSTCYIGFLNDETVLKYPLSSKYSDVVAVEAQIFGVLGYHPHILKYYGKNDHGLMLEYAANGSVKQYLAKNLSTKTKQRVTWCRELVEAVVHMHSKLADFQGVLKDPLTGSTVVTGETTESSKWHLPREAGVDSAKSDLFAVGSTIHEILGGYEPFPELHSTYDDEVVEARFAAAQFPDVRGITGGEIIRNCWYQQYGVANECLADLIVLEEKFE